MKTEEEIKITKLKQNIRQEIEATKKFLKNRTSIDPSADAGYLVALEWVLEELKNNESK